MRARMWGREGEGEAKAVTLRGKAPVWCFWM